MILKIFYVSVSHLYVFIGKCPFISSAHFMICLFVSCVLSLRSSLQILDKSLLSVVSFGNLHPFRGLPLSFFDYFLGFAEAYDLDEVPQVHFIFCFSCLWRCVMKKFAVADVVEVAAYVLC